MAATFTGIHMQVFDSRHQVQSKGCDLMTDSALKESETHPAPSQQALWYGKYLTLVSPEFRFFLFISVHILLSYAAAVRGTCGVRIWFRPPGGLHCSFSPGELESGPFVWTTPTETKESLSLKPLDSGCLANRPQDL